MKKFCKLFVSLMLIAALTLTVCSATGPDDAREIAYRDRIRAEEYATMMDAHAKSLEEPSVSLMSDTEIPDTLLELDGEYVWRETEPYIEIKFKDVAVGNGFNIVAQHKASGEMVDNYISANYQLIQDENHKTTGIKYYNMYTYYLKRGEYNIYIKDNKGNWYEPFIFEARGYSLNQKLYNNRSGIANLSFSLSMNDHYMYPWLKNIDAKFVSDDGNTSFEVKGLKPGYVQENYTYVYITFPDDITDGKYFIYPTFNMCDGSSIELMETELYIGNYIGVNSFYLDNSQVGVYTETLDIIIRTSFKSEDDEFEVVIKDNNGNIVTRETNYKIESMSTDSVDMHYLVDVKEKLEPKRYTAEYIYKGNRNIHTTSSTSLSFTVQNNITVNNTARVSSTEYICYIDGLEPGQYKVYKEDQTTSPYKKGEFMSNMTVSSDGKAVMKIDEAMGSYSTNVYINPANDEATEYKTYMYIPQYNNRNNAALPSVSSVTPSFVSPDANHIENMRIMLNYEYFINRHNVEYIQLVHNGKVIADGRNIMINNSNIQWQYNGYKQVSTQRMTFVADFDIDKDTVLTPGDTITVRISAEGNVSEKTIPVLDGTASTKASVSVNNAVSGYSAMVYDGEYDYPEMCEYASYRDLYFSVNNTNATSGEAVLYRYNTDTCSFEEKMRIDISDITPVKSYGYANNYPIAIRNVEPGCIYYLQFANSMSPYVYASEKPLIEVPYSGYLDVVEDELYYWMEYSGIDAKTAVIKAYFDGGDGNRVELPTEVWPDNSNGISIDMSFQNVPAFWSGYIILECNGRDISKIPAFDIRNKDVHVNTNASADGAGQYFNVNGDNALKLGKDATLYICEKDSFRLKDLIGKTVVEYPLDFSESSYANLDMALTGLEPGEYIAYTGIDGYSIGSSNAFIYSGHNTATEAVPMSLRTFDVSGDKASVSLTNRSDENYDEIKVLVAAYDKEGKLLDISEKDTYMKKYYNRTFSIDTVAGAADYKVFVVDRYSSMRPLLRY